MKTYTFSCHDTIEHCTTEVSFTTDSDVWSGYDGPMFKFFDFLKGCGFVFDIESEIGVLDKRGNFTQAAEF